MSGYWKSTFDIGRADVGRIMFFILSPVGFFMFFFGKLLERWAPGKLIVTGGAVAAVSTFLLPRAGSFSGVCLWAFVMGGATAMIYLSGLTVTQQWFPRRRGLVSGVYNLCFGVSAALMAPLYGRWLGEWGYAAERAAEYVAARPGSNKARLILAQSLVRLGRFDQAEQVLLDIPEEDRDGEVFFALGLSLIHI